MAAVYLTPCPIARALDAFYLPARAIDLALLLRRTALSDSFGAPRGRTQSRIRSLSTVASARRDDLLRGVDADVARCLDIAERARDSWQVLCTNFYSPPVIVDAMAVLSRLADLSATPFGGYPQAERCRLIVSREEEGAPSLANDLEESVAAVQVTGNFLFDPATHRDFLGAVLGTGIERTVVGDVLVQGDAGAQMLLAPSMVEHVETSLTQVRTVPVRTQRIPLSQLRVPPARIQELRSVESSMRCDSIASAGFRISRQKASDLIKGGDVRVNWRGGVKPSYEIRQGDIISCSGKGRVEVKEVSETKKGKFAVEMVRYI